MLPKDSKKNKASICKVSSFPSKNKKLDNNKEFNKHLNKNKNSKVSLDNNIKNNNNKNINLDEIINTKEKDKKKKNFTKYNAKSNNEKYITKVDSLTKQKTPNKLISEKKIETNQLITKKNHYAIENRKSPFTRSKTHYINDKKTKIINNDKKTKEKNDKGTTKLIEFLTALSPIDTSKCSKLINKNLNKILELENQVKSIIKNTQEEIKAVKENEKKNMSNNEVNKIRLEHNIKIIDKESTMRKEIYKLLFNFITDLLEQINKLSYSIANKEIIELNNQPKDKNQLLTNNNNSIDSNNSLFISEIQEEFCGRLINITKSFINSDIDLSEIKNNYQNIGKNFDKYNFIYVYINNR